MLTQSKWSSKVSPPLTTEEVAYLENEHGAFDLKKEILTKKKPTAEQESINVGYV